MDSKITINGLQREELNPILYDLVSILLKKFRDAGQPINRELKICIANDSSYQPNAVSEFRFNSILFRPKIYYKLTITRGILEKINSKDELDELETILAHELSHISHKDLFIRPIIVISGLIFIIMISLGSFLVTNNVVLSSIIIIFSLIVFLRIYHRWGRNIEIRSDKEAVTITKKYESYQRAMKRIFVNFDDIKNTLKISYKIKYYLKRVYSVITGNDHPTTPERIQNIENLKKE